MGWPQDTYKRFRIQYLIDITRINEPLSQPLGVQPTQLRIDKNCHFKIIAWEIASIPTPYLYHVWRLGNSVNNHTHTYIYTIYIFKAKVERKLILYVSNQILMTYVLCKYLSLIATIKGVGWLTQILHELIQLYKCF